MVSKEKVYNLCKAEKKQYWHR